MAKLIPFEPFFGVYPRTVVKRSFLRFASFTERERKYLAPKKILRLAPVRI